MAGQNHRNQPTSSEIFNAMAEAQQQALAKANMCDRFLHCYREYVGPVHDLQELQVVGRSPTLLCMRFAILKAVRDEENMKASVLANQMHSIQSSQELKPLI